MRAKIIGTGSYLPDNEVENKEFIENPFSFSDGRRIQNSNSQTIEKFQEITGIKARRYVRDEQSCSEIAYIAAQKAIEDANIDKETIECIIVAHNFGDVQKNSIQTDIVPSLASRVKHRLQIENPFCIPYDLIFGCPGWVQGLIQAHVFMKANELQRALVIGSEVLSRVVDPFDRDTMIFADGAGATVVERSGSDNGVIAHATVSHTLEETDYLGIGESFNRFASDKTKYIKMQGHKIYEYALKQVPLAMKVCMEKAGWDIDDVDKILIHQANEKMDEAIVKRFYRLYGIKEIPENIMPMIIERLGNSSVATVPTLYDMIRKNELPKHQLKAGDKILLASVGAGMNINCVAYLV